MEGTDRPSPLQELLFGKADGWHMQDGERTALMHILARIRPEISIEIGTLHYGSTRPIAACSGHVYSLDIDSKADSALANVTFVTGASSVTLPPLIERFNHGDQEVGFILIDGSHEEAAVRADLVNCLRYRPRSKPTVILMHDSSNPTVRKVIAETPWQDSPHVHVVDFDFVPGMLYGWEYIRDQIWGGLAAALLLPETRNGPIRWKRNFEHSLNALMANSVHETPQSS